MVNREDFDKSVQTISQLVTQYNQDINIRNGSVIRQLLIRPAAYVLAGIQQLLRTFIRDSSVTTLLSSQATENQTADLMAANFFTQRRPATASSGMLAIYSRVASLYIPANTTFSIQGSTFSVPSRVFISNTQVFQPVSQNMLVCRSYLMEDGLFCAAVPIVAAQPGYLQIPQGVPVYPSRSIAQIQQVQLVSPISGGQGVQTDSQLFSRIRDQQGYSAVDTRYAILKRLRGSGYNVISCYSVGRDGIAQARGFSGATLISTGGVVSVFVKTHNQSAIKQVQIVATQNGSSGASLVISPRQAAGALFVRQVLQRSESQASTPVTGTTVAYKASAESGLSDTDARFSAYQQIEITGASLVAGQSYIVRIQYMPNIAQLQSYIDRPQNKFVGQQLLLRAAVPVRLRVRCAMRADSDYTQQQLSKMRDDISRIINDTRVGADTFNMSDVLQGLQSLYPGIHIRLPIQMRITVVSSDGSAYTQAIQSGVLHLPSYLNNYTWPYCVHFICCTSTDIQVYRA